MSIFTLFLWSLFLRVLCTSFSRPQWHTFRCFPMPTMSPQSPLWFRWLSLGWLGGPQFTSQFNQSRPRRCLMHSNQSLGILLFVLGGHPFFYSPVAAIQSTPRYQTTLRSFSMPTCSNFHNCIRHLGSFSVSLSLLSLNTDKEKNVNKLFSKKAYFFSSKHIFFFLFFHLFLGPATGPSPNLGG